MKSIFMMTNYDLNIGGEKENPVSFDHRVWYYIFDVL